MLNDPASIEVTVQRTVEVDAEAFNQLALEFLAWATQGPNPLLLESPDAILDGDPTWSHDDLIAVWLRVRRGETVRR